jgi:hypothetical protein
MPFFTSLPTLPRKPYFESKIDENDVIGPDEKVPPVKLSEPDRWSTTDIAVKILQKRLLQGTALQFSIRDIKRILIAALR